MKPDVLLADQLDGQPLSIEHGAPLRLVAPAHYGYRDQRYKIIYFYNDGMDIPGTGAFCYPGEWELYDLQEDPDELRNVFHDSGYRSVRQNLQVKLWQAQHAVGDAPHPSQQKPEGA